MSGSAADDLDYMHARYYNPQVGRFLSVDPILGDPKRPQSWNRYSYVRGNSLKYTDPTGEYVVDCKGDATCEANAKNFEGARQDALSSNDADIRAAAEAYGDPGMDNGITLVFAQPATGGGAEVVADASWDDAKGAVTLVAIATFKSGLTGTELLEKVVHEGQHLRDAQGFVDTIDNSGTFDVSKNLTLRQTETNAYRLSHRVLLQSGVAANYGCSGCKLGKGVRPAGVDRAISRILSSPPYSSRDLSSKQFGRW